MLFVDIIVSGWESDYFMRKDKPSMTARKVALTIVALGEKQGMDSILPPGIVEATEKILVASSNYCICL